MGIRKLATSRMVERTVAMSVKRTIRMMLRNNVFLKRWVRPFLVWLFLDVLKRKQRLIQRYGFKVVELVDAAARSAGMPYFADCGTLLGLIREHGFIKHDTDMDFSMMPENDCVGAFYAELVKRGFEFERFVLFDGNLKEFTMSYNDISVDFFQRYYTDDRLAQKAVATKKDDYWPVFRLPSPSGLERIEVGGILVVVPKNFDQRLTSLYGDWKTPVQSWEDAMAPKYEKDYGVHTVVGVRDEIEWRKFLGLD